MKTKNYAMAAVAAVLLLFASACSSDDSESGGESATTAAEAAGTTATSATSETTATVADVEVPLPAAPVAETTTTTSSTSTTTTSSAPETSEPPSAATSSTTTSTTTTTSVAPATTISTTTTTTTSPPPATRQQAELRPLQRNNVQLPLPDDTPRDRYVPGLADINIYSQINDQGPLNLQAKLEELSIYLRYIGNYQPYTGATAENRDTQGTFLEAAKLLEDTLTWLGFTPQNTCGAPAGYTFTDLLQPTREWSEEFKVHRGDAIFTTDRLIELHGGQQINPEENLGFYIREAVQTAYDSLRLAELSDETEAPQLILCDAWRLPEGEIPETANAYWYALLTPGIQPRESLLSQGTYHVKEISRNGNFAYLIVCHPTIGARFVALHWREAGYRAEVVEDIRTSGCQAAFEEYDSYFAGTTPDGSGDYFTEDTISFGFGERVFSASDLQPFPRPQS